MSHAATARSKNRLAKQEEIEGLYANAIANLEAFWSNQEVHSRLFKIPIHEAEAIVTDALFDFLAEQLVDQDMDPKEAMKILVESMAKAADGEQPDVEKEEEEEGGGEDE
jgi:hypothetical protein